MAIDAERDVRDWASDYLNAEADSTIDPTEVGVDLILLDPAVRVVDKRGG